MQGACACYSTFEIMLPYAGIIRIRFMGMISASVSRGTPAIIFQISPQGRNDNVINRNDDVIYS